MAYSPKRGGGELQRGEQARRGLAPQVPVPLSRYTWLHRQSLPAPGHAADLLLSHLSSTTRAFSPSYLPLFGLTGNSYTNRLLTPGASALGIVSATNFGVAVRYKLQICSMSDGSPDGRLGPD